jgi:uncharacterized membrane protein
MIYIKVFSIFLIILGIILTSIAGYMDVKEKNEINVFSLHISKDHLFNDGTYVTVLAIALLMLTTFNNIQQHSTERNVRSKLNIIRETE